MENIIITIIGCSATIISIIGGFIISKMITINSEKRDVSNHKFFEFFSLWSQTRKEKIDILDDGSTNNDNRMGAVRDILFAIKTKSINDDIIVLAGDNLLDFSLEKFVTFSKDNDCNTIMMYYEKDLMRLRKTGVITFDDYSKVLSFEEKPHSPKSHYAVPPFYIFKDRDLSYINKCIEDGCEIDAPGMLLERFLSYASVYAWEMIGKRFDIGSLDDYAKFCE